MESYENTEIKVGEHFVIIRFLDEMENNRGLVIFDKTGNQINFDVVQEQRKLQHQHTNCCIYVEELNSKLYFYDIVDVERKDYDCYEDSQTDGSGFTIPRYYIFEPKKNKMEIKILEDGCQDLIKDGKVNCK